jgi:hypothetical protein
VASGGDQDIGKDTTNRNGTFRLGFLKYPVLLSGGSSAGAYPVLRPK